VPVQPVATNLADRAVHHCRRCHQPPSATDPTCADGTPLDATTGLDTQQENVITWLRGLGARSASAD